MVINCYPSKFYFKLKCVLDIDPDGCFIRVHSQVLDVANHSVFVIISSLWKERDEIKSMTVLGSLNFCSSF